ncbi:MAG TPA: methyltransferase, TIGR04325 family [Burkholderiaceae bacterium]
MRMRSFDAAFAAGLRVGCFRGVFATSAEAASAAPPTRPLGYDHDDAAAMYRDRLNRVYPADYPMMVWLKNAFADGARSVYDLGGHIGIAYYAYQHIIEFPNDVSWTVHDVPAVLESGRREAQQRDPARRLSFSDRHDAASGVDVLFTAGCLQYLEDTLAQRVAALQVKPTWLFVNLLPLHERRAYWTVQSIGTAFCPYRIQHTKTFFSDLQALGYDVLDTWENPEKECWIAFDPDHSLDRYHGAALRLRS